VDIEENGMREMKSEELELVAGGIVQTFDPPVDESGNPIKTWPWPVLDLGVQ
jgi:hypothetical protein